MRMTPVLWGCLLVMADSGFAQLPPGLPVQSRSGQFLVSFLPARSAALSPLISNSSSKEKLRRLVPDLLAVSCERIKHDLLRALDIPERAGSRIFVTIRRNSSRDEPINFFATFYPDGWQYRLELPEQAEEEKVVQALVQTLLVEFANRQAGERSAEIPLWLAEGLTQHLLASGEADLVLEPPADGSPIGFGRGSAAPSLWRQKGFNNVGIRRDLLFQVRRTLSNNAPLSFSELSLPDVTQFNGPKWQVYKGCSQLLVHQLLSLNSGHENMRAMLTSLPRYLNWQTAFLRSFGENFGNLLEVEKWWAIVLANFTGRDHWQMWPREASLERLTAVLTLPIQVQAGTNELPARAEMSVQQIIQELDFGRQKIFLSRALSQLVALRTRMLPELVPLLDGYCQILESYLEVRGQAGFAAPRRGQPSIAARILVQDTIRKLTALDQQRKALTEQRAASIRPQDTPE